MGALMLDEVEMSSSPLFISRRNSPEDMTVICLPKQLNVTISVEKRGGAAASHEVLQFQSNPVSCFAGRP